MRFLKTFETYTPEVDQSTEYYTEFSIDDFPEVITFDNPKATYKRTKLIPGSNKVLLRYDLDSEQPDKDNPYSGDITEIVTVEIDITYKENITKSFVNIIGGNNIWRTFSYEGKSISDIEVTDNKLSEKSFNDIIKILDKYSKI